ncbi:MAG: PcfJ domain-containing protein [Candidatus Riflebacteria bacterium]|nr:PcfJ domain-containing protein [Candidatus Riflebacteria bacterium]
MNFEFQGTLVLEAELLNVGARARLFRTTPSIDGITNRRPLWFLTVNVRPPLVMRSGLMRQLPDLLFDKDAVRHDSLDSFLRAPMSLIRFDNPDIKGSKLADPEEVTSSLLEIQRHLITLLLPVAAETAALFPSGSSMRWWIYELIANDESGRMAQMAKVCPGVLILAMAIQASHPAKMSELLDMTAAGVKLGKILDTASEIFATGPKASELGQIQRIRIARAGPFVPPSLLMSVPDGGIVPEDIPDDPKDNLAWFKAQIIAEERANNLLAGPCLKSFMAFISRHAVELWRIAKTARMSFEQLITQLCDYARATDRYPGRTTSPEKLLQESRQWHDRQEYLRLRMPPERRGEASREISPEQPLDPGPIGAFQTWKLGEDVIRFLPTAGDLLEESRRMHHCVASYASKAIQGNTHIFHAEIAGEPSTIELSFSNGKPTLRQAAGIKNKKPREEAMNTIKLWFEDLFMALMASTRGTTPRLNGQFEGPLTALKS